MSSAPLNKERIRAVLKAIFAADAQSLGSHWVYNKDQIVSSLGENIVNLNDPVSQYHKGKQAGDLTHYGNLLLAGQRSVAEKKAFEHEHWFAAFKAQTEVKEDHDYPESFLKGLFENIAQGKKGPDAAVATGKDLFVAGLFFPLIALHDNVEDLVREARFSTSLLHSPPEAHDLTETFARALFSLLSNKEKLPSEALREAIAVTPTHNNLIESGLASGKALRSDSDAAAEYGISCAWEKGIPLVAHFVAKFENQGKIGDALIANSRLGGESAVRAQLIAALLVAHEGDASVPKAWFEGIKKKKQIEESIDRLLL